MNSDDYVNYIIRPTLIHLEPEITFSLAAVNLILMTAIVESNLKALKQRGGPALGLLQMEPTTEQSLFADYLAYRNDLMKKVVDLTIRPMNRINNLAANLHYQVALARIKYYQDSKPLPDINDIGGMAAYYKRIYNTPLGKASTSHAEKVYEGILNGHV